MRKRDASEKMGVLSELDEVTMFTGPPLDRGPQHPCVGIEEKQTECISPAGCRQFAVTMTSRPPQDLDQTLKSCGAPPPSVQLKPYIRIGESKGRLHASGTVSAPEHKRLKDLASLKPSRPAGNKPPKPPKPAPVRRRWVKPPQRPPESPKYHSPKIVTRPKRPKPRRARKRSASDPDIRFRNKEKAEPMPTESPSFWAKIKGVRRKPLLEEKPRPRSGLLLRTKSIPTEELLHSELKCCKNKYCKDKTDQRLSKIISESLADGVLKPSDVKRLQKSRGNA